MFTDTLKNLVDRRDLDEEQANAAMDAIMSGKCTDAQIGAFLAAMAAKGETFAELAGAARAMRKKAARIQATSGVVVDTCGTGGDGAHTFNISTTAAFIVAGCGVTVAKHGNRSVSSKCGSADVLKALGVRLDVAPEVVEEAVNEIGIGFLFAPTFHGAMRHAAGPRKELGIRSIFNMLGPLTNPAGANCQVLGVYAPQFAEALRLLGAKRAFVVHGHDGLDEITVCGKTRVSELSGGMIRTYDLDPETLLGRTYDSPELSGGGPEENAGITREVLSGKPGARADVCVINAAAALVAAGKAEDLADGVKLARESIAGGAAMDKLEKLASFTWENA
ncbi:MAG: anthranilate phosphoribosyltransferase [Deltaproteobacteria bacterium]|nr:anthranilate phosphoribosyltransferase [Deltaproteobacteria bacterium]